MTSVRRLILLLALAVGLAAAAAIAWNAGVFEDRGQPDVGGPFQLVDQDGRAADESILKGKWTAVFFGFTYCPDICPTTLQALAAAQAQLGPRADDFQVVLISVDPERDTPEQLKAYLSNDIFPTGAVGLTGTPDQVDAAAKAYRAYYSRSGAGDDVVVNHFSGAYLMNPKGRFDRILPYGVSPEELARQISDAMRS